MNMKSPIELGKIASAHGLGGEVNYVPFNLASELPFEGMEITLRLPDGKSTVMTVESIRDKGKFLIVGLAGCTDRNAAEKLRGAIVCCDRDDLPELAPDEFYYRDAIGLPVMFPDGQVVGKVSQVLSLATDVIEITSDSGQEWMIPVVEGFVRRMDRDAVIIEPDALEME
ncbi:MAG TPA: ribosome maturation factor RimM [Myxococcota bacterium]|nr:ribosome maturation factor RimM [Myxococcota bacterium]HPV04840.1 ribosome maturation factor RimM [Myxococcota bacterium]